MVPVWRIWLSAAAYDTGILISWSIGIPAADATLSAMFNVAAFAAFLSIVLRERIAS